MPSHKRIVPTLFLVGLLAATVFGCGQLPTSPNSAQTQASAKVAATAEPASLLSSVGGVLNTLVGLIVRTLNLIGSIGGSLSNGRWRITIPAGAVDGNATVSLGVPNLTSPDCALEISPSDKNHFSTAATLTVDCSNVMSSQLASYVIYWYNPSTKQWVELSGSKVNLTNKTVSVQIFHFSQYSVGPTGGRAGW
jgi:hypothetical protein